MPNFISFITFFFFFLHVIDKCTFPMQVSMWVQLQIPKIEDGNNFGVAVQVGHSRRSIIPLNYFGRWFSLM